MYKIWCTLFVFIILTGGTIVSAQDFSSKDIEEVLLIEFQHQVLDSARGTFGITSPQIEHTKVLSIKEEVLHDPSQELKPGKVFEVRILAEIKNILDNKNKLIIKLSNDNPSGKFKVISIKKL